MPERPLCIALVPPALFESVVRPAIEAAHMTPIWEPGHFDGPALNHLLLYEYAIADLSDAPPALLFAIGARYAARPSATLIIHSRESKDLREGLLELRLRGPSPILSQLLPEARDLEIAHAWSDTFRRRTQYDAPFKQSLAEARERRDIEALNKVEAALAPLEQPDTGALIDLLLSYRALSQWERMLNLCDRLPAPLRRAAPIREQLAFALNRLNRRDDALALLEAVLQEQGPSSETCALIGRVYKDRWEESGSSQDLDRAIAAYLQGFETDCRDAFPGINAATLLEARGGEVSWRRKREIVPVVRFAVMLRVNSPDADYWDHATLIELAVLDSDRDAARRHLAFALTQVREPWEPQTTVRNLILIRDARRRRGIDEPWLDEIIVALTDA